MTFLSIVFLTWLFIPAFMYITILHQLLLHLIQLICIDSTFHIDDMILRQFFSELFLDVSRRPSWMTIQDEIGTRWISLIKKYFIGNRDRSFYRMPYHIYQNNLNPLCLQLFGMGKILCSCPWIRAVFPTDIAGVRII